MHSFAARTLVHTVVMVVWASLVLVDFSNCEEHNENTFNSTHSTTTSRLSGNLSTSTLKASSSSKNTDDSKPHIPKTVANSSQSPVIPVPLEDSHHSHPTRTYDIQYGFPKLKKKKKTANLAILPILAILAFIIALCLKGCTWLRESIQDKEQDVDDDDMGFIILTEGDKEYDEIDLRSNFSTPYDTYNSYMSFLRRNNNSDTINSVRSFQNQTSRPYDTVTSYRSLLMQRLDSQNSESVNSYRAFLKLQQASQMKDVQIQVELLNDKSESEPKPNRAKVDKKGFHGQKHHQRLHHNNVMGREVSTVRPPTNGKDNIQNSRRHSESGAKVNHEKSQNGKENREQSTASQRVSSPERSSMNEGHPLKSIKFQRFKVSFVMDETTGAGDHHTVELKASHDSIEAKPLDIPVSKGHRGSPS